MIQIDGSSGGGQMLRSAVSMSTITGKDFRMENIRGSRPNPGLKRQHIEAVKAAKRLSSAEVSGLREGGQELVFRPRNLRPGSFTANIGTAGSVTLLLDTILPVASQFNQGFRLTVKGGTDVKWSPTIEYFRQVKLPILRKFGFRASAELERTGYYPRGGGKVTLETDPYSLEKIVLDDRGELQGFKIYSKASEELEEQEVADRQADEAARLLKNSHISAGIEKKTVYVDTDSTGSSLLVKAVYEDSVAGFDALGEEGKRSETVAQEAVRDFREFHSSSAAVDRYMADQLMVFLALTGGKVSVASVTGHVQTNLEVLERFGAEIEIEKGEKNVLKA